MAGVRRSLSDNLSTSDSSSDLSSCSETDTPAPHPDPILSLYRRELTEKGTEISQLKERLDKARIYNLHMERALAMRQLTSYELESDLRDTQNKLWEEERLRKREEYFSAQSLKGFSGERNFYNLGPSYEYQSQPCIDTKHYRQDYPDTHRPQTKPSVEPELVTPLTYHKRVILPGRWITHTPAVSNYYGLFQPQKMKGKHVTQPSKRDLVGKNPIDKYMLNHQQTTPDGSHMVTTLYKGDVTKTRSGGAQVRFTDTEVLHQREGIHGLPLHSKQFARDTDLLPARPTPKRGILKHSETRKQTHGAEPRVRFATLKDIDNIPANPAQPRGTLKSLFRKQGHEGTDPELRFATMEDVENDPSEYWARQLV